LLSALLSCTRLRTAAPVGSLDRHGQ
jgi:hypothetical protein